MERLILDTAAFVAAERSKEHVAELIADEDGVAMAAITVAELLVGVADRRRRRPRSLFVEAILDAIPVEPYDMGTARAHASLLAHARRAGQASGARDLIIAATALSTDRTVVTTDRAGFEGLPGVRLQLAG